MSGADGVIAALRASHDRLASLAGALTPEQVTAPAYPSEWSIAQVFSHLGSGAEIFMLNLMAGLSGAPAPGREANPPIWDRWNAKQPWDQVLDAVATDLNLVATLEAFTPRQRDEVRFPSFLGEVGVERGGRLRLAEHAVHTWDIAVALDRAATVGVEALDYVVDGLEMVARFSGKAGGLSAVVRVSTTDPARVFTLRFDDQVTLTPGDEDEATASLQLPAEAFIRLLYGRLDAAHTPPLTVTGVDLDDLRRAFPGF